MKDVKEPLFAKRMWLKPVSYLAGANRKTALKSSITRVVVPVKWRWQGRTRLLGDGGLGHWLGEHTQFGEGGADGALGDAKADLGGV